MMNDTAQADQRQRAAISVCQEQLHLFLACLERVHSAIRELHL